MTRRWLAGLDAGSRSGRCVLVDVDTAEVVCARRAWHHRPARDAGPVGLDMSTSEIWSLLVEATREALERAGARATDVVAIATSGMRHSTVLVDRSGGISFATPSVDARAFGPSSALAAERGDEIERRTGHWPAPLATLCRLLWLGENAPRVIDDAQAVLGVSGWIAYKLTGELAMEASIASETLLCEISAPRWADDLIASLGVARSLLPPIAATGTRLGPLRDGPARELGLSSGIPVIVGGGDTQCGLIGAGAVASRDLCVIAGTTMPIDVTVDEPVVDRAGRLWTSHHAVPGLWTLESNAGAVGDALEWVASALYGAEPGGVARLAAEASESEPGAMGIVSSIGAEIFNARELHLPLGHLTLSTMMAASDPNRRRHLARAILEGVAFAVRGNAEQALETARVARSDARARLGGGLTRSRFFCQLLSDVLGVPVIAPATPETSGLGAAICAGAGAGLYSGVADAARALVRVERTYEPSAPEASTYRRLYEQWLELRAARATADAVATDMALQSVLATPEVGGDIGGADASFRPRILVTAQMDERGLAQLRALGDVEYRSFHEQLELLVGDDLVDALRGVHVFITEVDVVGSGDLARLPDLRVVVSCRGNPVNIDVPACTAHGIPVLYAPGRNADAVADLTLAFMLMLCRKLPEATAFLRQPGGEAGDTARMGVAFDRLRGRELRGKTVGVVGLGAVGSRVASRLAPFGARVLVHDPFTPPERIAAAGAEAIDLAGLLRESDIVTLHAATGEDGEPLLGRVELMAMKPGALLVNTARAALVDESALVFALTSGQLGGAAIDVFAIEPPGADDPLLALPNVIATPHVGGNTEEVAGHQGASVSESLREMLSGRRPRHVLDARVLEGFSWTGARIAPSAEELASLQSKPGPAVTDIEARRATPSAPARPPPPPDASPPPGQPRATSQPTEPQTPATLRGRLLGKLRGMLTIEPARAAPPAPASSAPARAGIAPPSLPREPSPAALRSHMERVLDSFLSRTSADDDVKAYAAGKSFSTCYRITDVDLAFFMRFRDGAVTCALGEPPEPASVTLKMTAEVFDQLLTGRASGPKLAMSGKLSFTGDTLTAMSMRRIQKSLERSYAQARATEPGLDALLADAQQPAPSPPSVASAPRGPESGIEDERHELVRALEELYGAGLITSTGGNISVRSRTRAGEAWITPNQMHKGALRADMLVRIDLEGNPLDPGSRAPSSERLIHSMILRDDPRVHAVVHSHAPEATTLALAELAFLPISTEAAFIGEIPRVPFMMPGTPDLAAAVAAAMKGARAVLMQNHGLVVASGDLHQAVTITRVIEETAHKIVTCHALGRTPPVLPEELVRSLQELGEMMA